MHLISHQYQIVSVSLTFQNLNSPHLCAFTPCLFFFFFPIIQFPGKSFSSTPNTIRRETLFVLRPCPSPYLTKVQTWCWRTWVTYSSLSLSLSPSVKKVKTRMNEWCGNRLEFCQFVCLFVWYFSYGCLVSRRKRKDGGKYTHNHRDRDRDRERERIIGLLNYSVVVWIMFHISRWLSLSSSVSFEKNIYIPELKWVEVS